MICSRYQKECRHYQTILKKKCFKKLKNNVWERKTKGPLLEQAEHQHRIKLLKKCMNSWLAYLNRRYNKKVNLQLAEMHYEGKLKWKVITALKRSVEQNWILVRLCRKNFEWNIKYKSWHQWKHYVEKRLKMREVKLLANRIREERTRSRFFYLWVFRLREKQSLENACKEAAKKYEFKLKEKCFKSWRIVTGKMICKKRIQNLAVTCYEDKLKQRSLRRWKQHSFQRRRYRCQAELVRSFYENYLRRNYVGRWHAALRKVKLERKICNFNFALSFHERKLMEKSFRVLLEVRERKRGTEEKLEKFRKAYVRIYLDLWIDKRAEKLVWNHLEARARRWREGYLTEAFLLKLWGRQRERVEEREEMTNVVLYYNAVIVHRTFREWRQRTVERNNKKIRLDNAYKLYLDRLVNKTFEKWKQFAGKKSRKKMANEYYRLTTLSKIMKQWRTLEEERKIKLARAKTLELKRSRLITKQTFEYWYTQTQISKAKLISAINFHDRTKLSRAFSIWRKIARTKAVYRARYNRNKAFLDVIVVKNMIFRWYEMHSVKLNLEKKLRELRLKQDRRSLGVHFYVWRGFVEKMKALLENAEEYPQLKANALIEQYLMILLQAVRSKKILNGKEELAKGIELKLLKRRYLRKWVAFVCWKREKILRCLSGEGNHDTKETFDVFIPLGKGRRRKPMIPNYLKAHIKFGQVMKALIISTLANLHPVIRLRNRKSRIRWLLGVLNLWDVEFCIYEQNRPFVD